MCGVTGFNWKNERLLHKMGEAIRHRGPDSEETYVDGSVSLGHRRLTVFNPSGDGHQSMPSEDGSLVISFNGRIHNYSELLDETASGGDSLKSRGDAELILDCYKEYGTDCVQHFNGMWAFCIYDKAKQTLFLSRDRFGIKPLYYYYDGSSFIFASEIKAILEHDIPRKENREIIFDYLYYNLTDHTEDTFFEGIRRLMPGHNLVFDLRNGKMEISEYYNIRARIRRTPADYEKIRELFTGSVRRSVASDAPVGSCLSGGIDSSSIVVTMRKVDPDALIKTFSMKFPGKNIDESMYQKDVSRKAGALNYSVTPEPAELMRDLEDLFMTQEEPFSGTSVYGQYRVMKLAKDNGVTVLLDGQGADQVLSGSSYFNGYYYYELMKRLDIVNLLREASQSYHKSRCLSPLMYLFLRVAPEDIKRSLYNHHKVPYLARSFIKENEHRKDIRWYLSSLDEAVCGSVSLYALPHLLRFLDKNSMRFSIESRLPFLDHVLVEYLLSLPSAQRINNGVTKYAFRKAMEGELPESVLARHDKIGFATPEESWLNEKRIRDFVYRIIDSEDFRSRDFWSWALVKDMFKKLHSGESQNIFVGTEIWRCISVELWMRMFIERKGFPATPEESGIKVPIYSPIL
ncbi:asparagine synthase (glutamine-hydrolyzing) [Methanolobus chelungpuianus]|uniref:Putative asparagine synthetase [glutamine-hydrolyzing] n=1 Tax=Methanolobus chelungpuianus TaxID=502115 RepID=A0AAE3HB16_9EURY|nr:asparagine synthase (glutamine-hydrolyzing) [Methanolobus chelungpuianus]MCQ6963392.1 asparagine synthase [Methanolobus chelungpuianus]